MKDFLLNVWRCVAVFASDVFWHLLYRPRGIGRENIPASGGVIICPNHLSNMDPMFVGYHILQGDGRFSSRKIWSPTKEELFNHLPLRLALRSLRAFPVRRKQRDIRAMNHTIDLARNDVVIVYPEGTRSKDGALQPGKAGVGKIIRDSGATVIPAAVFNTHYCLPKGARFPRFFLPLAVVFGKPVDISKYLAMPDCKETSQAIVDEVMKAIAALQKEYAHLDIRYKGGQ